MSMLFKEQLASYAWLSLSTNGNEGQPFAHAKVRWSRISQSFMI